MIICMCDGDDCNNNDTSETIYTVAMDIGDDTINHLCNNCIQYYLDDENIKYEINEYNQIVKKTEELPF